MKAGSICTASESGEYAGGNGYGNSPRKGNFSKANLDKSETFHSSLSLLSVYSLRSRHSLSSFSSSFSFFVLFLLLFSSSCTFSSLSASSFASRSSDLEKSPFRNVAFSKFPYPTTPAITCSSWRESIRASSMVLEVLRAQ